MALILIFAYCILLIAQIVLLAAKRNTVASILALVSLIAAVILAAVFNALPGYGMMPGLSWFSEFFYSMAAAAAYAVMLVLTLILRLVRKKK